MGDLTNLTMGWRSMMMIMLCLPIILVAMALLFRTIERTACRYLAGFLIVVVLGMGPQVVGYAGFYTVWPGLTFFPPFFLELWLAPLAYAHAYKLMHGGPLGWRKYLFIPGIIQVLYYSYAFWGHADYKEKWAFNDAVHHPYILPVETILSVVLAAFLAVATWRLYVRYKAFLNETQSRSLELDPLWLRNMMIGLGVGLVLYMGLEIVDLVAKLSYNTAFPILCLIAAFVLWVALDAAWRLNQTYPKMGNHTLADPTENDLNQIGDLGSRIKKVIEDKRAFLEPRLSIKDIAQKLGTNESYVSRALNKGEGQSFNTYVNSLRIEQAKRALSQSDADILTIALDSGFNSKATFNRVFRAMTGQTPSQFRRQFRK